MYSLDLYFLLSILARIEPHASVSNDVLPEKPASSLPVLQATRIAQPIMEEDEETDQNVIEGEPCVTAELLMPPPPTAPSKTDVCYIDPLFDCFIIVLTQFTSAGEVYLAN